MSEPDHFAVTETEMLHAMLGVAKVTKTYYDALLEEGWTEAQAFKLTIAWQHALCGGKAPEA